MSTTLEFLEHIRNDLVEIRRLTLRIYDDSVIREGESLRLARQLRIDLRRLRDLNRVINAPRPNVGISSSTFDRLLHEWSDLSLRPWDLRVATLQSLARRASPPQPR